MGGCISIMARYSTTTERGWKNKTILHYASRPSDTSARTSGMTYCMQPICNIDFYPLCITHHCYNNRILHNQSVHWCVLHLPLRRCNRKCQKPNKGEKIQQKKKVFAIFSLISVSCAWQLHVSSDKLCNMNSVILRNLWFAQNKHTEKKEKEKIEMC